MVLPEQSLFVGSVDGGCWRIRRKQLVYILVYFACLLRVFDSLIENSWRARVVVALPMASSESNPPRSVMTSFLVRHAVFTCASYQQVPISPSGVYIFLGDTLASPSILLFCDFVV